MPLIQNRYFASIVLTAALFAATVGSGCAMRATTGVRIYDRDRRDYHNWDDREDRAYRQYLAERRENYREYSRLNRREQNDYWNWRHIHPDQR
jgi:hypothetical protein